MTKISPKTYEQSEIGWVGSQLHSARLHAKLQVKEAAELLSVQPRTITCWEMGKKMPSVQRLQEIALAYNTCICIGFNERPNFAKEQRTSYGDASYESRKQRSSLS